MKMNLFKGIPLFYSLGPVLLARLADSSGSLKFSRSVSVLEKGKACNNLFIVALGKLEVYKKMNENTELILETLSKGDIFGEEYVMEGSPVTDGLRAAENSVVVGIDRLTLNTLIRDNPEFSRNFIKYMAGRMRGATAREDSLLKILLSSGLEIPDPYSLNEPVKKLEEALPPARELSQVNVPEDQEEDGGGQGFFFWKEFSCPLCANRFRTLKPRQKHITVEKVDEDFCLYYKSVNPLFYEINVCPKCGYSFNTSASSPVKDDLKKGLAKMLAGMWKKADYCGSRTLDEAVQAFRLAIECQRLMGADDSNMGKLFLKLGWLYRYLNNKEMENQSLDKALSHLSKSFETSTSKDPKEEINLMFLLGQLHLILGDDRGAVNWFVRITQHPDRKSYPYMVNRARDSWQEIRRKTAKT